VILLTERYVKMNNEKLSLNSEAMGKVKIGRKFIDSFKTDKKIGIHTPSGEKYFGRQVDSGPGRVVLITLGEEKT